MGDKGSGGGSRSRGRATLTSPGATVQGAQSPIRASTRGDGRGGGAAANSATGSDARPSNMFGALAEDGADDGDTDTGVQFPATSPFFSSWFSKNTAARKLGHLPLEPLLPYLPASDGSLFHEALGFQSSVDPERAVADIALTAPMDSVLVQLRQRQDFDVNMFQGFFIPEDGLNAQHVINLFALFDKTLLGISPSCCMNAAAICKASPDLLVQSAVGSSDSLGIGCIFTDPRHNSIVDPCAHSRFYGSSTMPLTSLKLVRDAGPFFRNPSKYDPARHAQVLAFNESQFDFSKHYYGRDVLYSFRVFSEVQRLFYIFLQKLAEYAKMQGRTWASTYATQLEHLGKMYTDNTLVDLSVLPTFAYLAMKSHSCDCSRGALGFQLLLSQFSTLPLPSHSADIAWLYSLQLDGHVPVLEELAAYQKKWELIRESSIHPDDPFSPHPAVVEPLVVSVFLCALRDLISRASVTQLRAANLVTLRHLSKTCENLRTFDGIRAEIGKIPVAELLPLNPTGLVAQSYPAGVPSTANAISSGTVLAATTSSGGVSGDTKSSNSRKQSKTPKVPVPAATIPAGPRTPSDMFSSLKAYVVQRDDIYYARTDKATGKRKMIPPDQYKALPADTRAALIKLKTVPRKDLEADASVKAAPTKKPNKPKKTHDATALLATSADTASPSVGAFSQFGPAAGQFMVNDPRQGFMPYYDQRQHVLAAQYAQMPPPFPSPLYQFGMQPLPAPSEVPRATATVLSVGHQGQSGWGDPYGRASASAPPPSHLLNSGGGGNGSGLSFGGGVGGVSQSGGGGGYQIGGGGYQGAPSFFPGYSQQPPPAMLQARSVKMLGSNAAADSRAGDPGEWR